MKALLVLWLLLLCSPVLAWKNSECLAKAKTEINRFTSHLKFKGKEILIDFYNSENGQFDFQKLQAAQLKSSKLPSFDIEVNKGPYSTYDEITYGKLRKNEYREYLITREKNGKLKKLVLNISARGKTSEELVLNFKYKGEICHLPSPSTKRSVSSR